MTKLVVSSLLRSQLNNLDVQMELCDESGQLLGCFMPAAAANAAEYAWAKAQFSEAEAEIARRQTGGITTAELLKRLGAS
jgi:hypothetical protein